MPRSLFWTLVYSKLVQMAVMSAVGALATGFMQGAELWDPGMNGLLRGFVRWDAVHFLHIARDGYRHEQQFAFLPVWPLLIRAVSSVLPIGCAAAGVLLANTAHVAASVVLYHLTGILFPSERFAQLSTLAFAWSGAAAFQTGIYSESLFALTSFAGLLWFYRERWARAALLWAVGSGLRSNGVLMAGFFWFSLARHRKHVVKTILCTALVCAPFVAHLYHGYKAVCPLYPGGTGWCQARLPNIYAHVQREYWNVGPFRYWTANNLPNFVLAAPMVALSLYGIWRYVRADPKRMLMLHATSKRPHGLFREDILIPHVYLLSFMLLYTLAVVHVQIIGRLFSFMPIIPWLLAHLAGTGRQWPLLAFSLYGLLNCVLFAAFLPPA